jgi:hypothetical protein
VARDGQKQDGAGDRRRADPIHHPHFRRGRQGVLCLLASCRGFLEVVLRRRGWDRLLGVVAAK